MKNNKICFNGLILLLFLSFVACSGDESEATATDLSNPSIPFPAPSDLVVTTVDATTCKIEWKDNSDGEDGFVIMRNKDQAGFKTIATLPNNQVEYLDKKCGMGQYEYQVYAFYQQRKSEFVFASFYQPWYPSIPTVLAPQLTSNYARITAEVTLSDSGGENSELGVCWSDQANPTIDNANMVSPFKQASNELVRFYIPNIVLDYGKTYYVRGVAKNRAGIAYGPVSTLVFNSPNTPSEIILPWSSMVSEKLAMPSDIELFTCSTTLNGRAFKAWYAIADLSSGNVQLKTNYSPVKATTSSQFELIGNKCRVLVNGGYFNTTNNDSYSLLVDKGVVKSNNIAVLGRGNYSYAVTRSAFGVDANGKPSVKWVYTFPADQVWAYDQPLLNVEGEPGLPSPTKTFPTGGAKWDIYSAVGGAPLLLKDSKLLFDFEKTSKGKYISNYELLQADIFDQGRLQPRTAIGYTADNKVVLLVVDGRQTESAGVTIDELALIMKGLGCTNALHLDGGGSSTMVAGNNSSPILINRPEGGSYQRPVPTTVGFVVK